MFASVAFVDRSIIVAQQLLKIKYYLWHKNITRSLNTDAGDKAACAG
jgi:hypothetical protein